VTSSAVASGARAAALGVTVVAAAGGSSAAATAFVAEFVVITAACQRRTGRRSFMKRVGAAVASGSAAIAAFRTAGLEAERVANSAMLKEATRATSNLSWKMTCFAIY